MLTDLAHRLLCTLHVHSWYPVRHGLVRTPNRWGPGTLYRCRHCKLSRTR